MSVLTVTVAAIGVTFVTVVAFLVARRFTTKVHEQLGVAFGAGGLLATTLQLLFAPVGNVTVPVSADSGLPAPAVTATLAPTVGGGEPTAAPSATGVPTASVPTTTPVPTATDIPATPTATGPTPTTARAVLAPAAEPIPANAMWLGESRVVDGVRIALTDYDVSGAARQSIKLSFAFKNERDQPLTVGYYNTAINVRDDRGSSFENTGTSWDELKQRMLDPGESVIVEPGRRHEFRGLGTYEGEIAEDARYLFVTFSPFMGQSDLQWVIDLNPSSGQAQLPPPNKPVVLRQAYVGDGLRVALDSYEIETDRISLAFFVQNTTDHPIVMRYRNTSIDITDDTGTIFVNDGAGRASAYIKMVRLAPGETIQLYSYTRTHELQTIGRYEGQASPNATFLIVRFARLMGLTDMEWHIPL